MTEKNKRHEIHKADHSTFGGIICVSDFYTNYTNGDIAKRIAGDWAFDNWCRNNKGNSYKLPKGRNKKND